MATVKGIPTEMELLIASSTGKHIEAKAKEVYIETDDGDLGVLPGHQPEFYSISAGFVRFKDIEGKETVKLLFNGFVQIEPEIIRIGVQDIYEPEEVNIEIIENEISELKEKLSSLSEEETETRQRLESEISKRELLVKKAR
ncbi:ATP synthase epsilon chain [Desulfurobacterium thermolithotrophum DSM 11699]|uniref:ATP synthase epsilon chain n=1 Tax=Desulfurobacterium thermolithotrophum (strain DSM 11699 / BSA) TaxID=868864 RepID=F0S112_DESTD|nr:ATP synthase F1 subunit epsilon [Desulfurobacterium thermolithotrophum]ADY73890.1 ATP synthase epsilon chain [Desulfurobacterium thermolithotrophum DSM 11699]